MTPTGNPDPPKQPIESVLAEFDGKKETLTAFCLRTKDLIEQILQDANIPFQSVQARVKSREKLKQKYLNPEKNYRQLDDVTDQAGLRVITYYEDEVDRVAEAIKQEFHIDTKNSVDKREVEPNKFGYYALNYVCKYADTRISQVEYKRFSSILCEIQITSILRHAWSEIEHPWYDVKGAFPDQARIERRFARMAALLEIAEDEFLNLRKIRSDYQKSLDVQVAANVPDVPVDVVSLRSLIKEQALVTEVDTALASVVGRPLSDVSDGSVRNLERAIGAAGLKNIQQVYTSLAHNKQAIIEFVGRCKDEGVWAPITEETLPVGVSLFQLAQLLMSAKGVETISNFVKTRAPSIDWPIARQVEIAQEAIERLPKPKS